MVQRVGPGGWKHAPTRGVSSLALSCVPTLPRLVASAGRAAPVQGPADAERRRVDVPSAVRLDSQRRLHLAVIFGALGKCCHGSLCVPSARSVSITPNGICDGCQCMRWCLLFRIMMVFKREENSPRRPAAPARARGSGPAVLHDAVQIGRARRYKIVLLRVETHTHSRTCKHQLTPPRLGMTASALARSRSLSLWGLSALSQPNTQAFAPD